MTDSAAPLFDQPTETASGATLAAGLAQAAPAGHWDELRHGAVWVACIKSPTATPGVRPF